MKQQFFTVLEDCTRTKIWSFKNFAQPFFLKSTLDKQQQTKTGKTAHKVEIKTYVLVLFRVIDYFFEMSITISNHCFKDAGLNGLLIVIIMFMVNRLQ